MKPILYCAVLNPPYNLGTVIHNQLQHGTG